MVIGVVGLSVPLVWIEVFDSDVLVGEVVAGVVSVISETIVVDRLITINNQFAATTATVAVKHPSKHNIY